MDTVFTRGLLFYLCFDTITIVIVIGVIMTAPIQHLDQTVSELIKILNERSQGDIRNCIAPVVMLINEITLVSRENQTNYGHLEWMFETIANIRKHAMGETNRSYSGLLV